MKFKNMFSPIQIGPMTVKNRFVVPPMGNNFANSDGTWSDESVAYYGERAKGQFGLITIEATVVHKGAKGGPKKPCLYDDNSIESLKKITDACHEEGAKVSIQLQNAGPEGNAKNAGAPIQAATAIASADGRDIPEEVSTEKVYELVKGYGEAAERAMKGGADAVEIHMAHGYLVNSFMSPRTNKRVDEFGGNFENRMRFSRLIIEEVKKKTEGKIAVLARINSTEDMFGGLDNHDMCAVASYLEDCGIDGLHVSRAVHLKDEYMWAPTGIHGGFSAELVANIKKCVSIPVITVGRYTEPQFAEQIIKMGNADLVAFGRQSLADPHTPQKAMEERLEDLTPCIACLQGCVANMYAGKPICCLVNPVLGHEKEGLPKAEKAKKVYVIGGGVAGMCAAFTAKRRGHDVTLFEARELCEAGCLCRMAEGNVTYQPRYILPDYEKLMREGCKFLRLDPPENLFEAIQTLEIFYRHVPSVTHYPVYLGSVDKLLEPFMDDENAYKLIKSFLIFLDRSIPDSYCHMNLGPEATRAGEMIVEIETELKNAIPSITLLYDPDITPDDFAEKCVICALNCAKPSFANHKMYRKLYDGAYGIASCYNALPIAGGSFTLSRVVLSRLAERAKDSEHFLEELLPRAVKELCGYIENKIEFLVEKSHFFKSNFLVQEGFVKVENFTGMFGVVGMNECVNTLMEKEHKGCRYNRSRRYIKRSICNADRRRSIR